MSDALPTVNSPTKVPLKKGGHALVRVASRSMKERILIAAGNGNPDTSRVQQQQLLTRWGIVGMDDEAKKHTPFTKENNHALGGAIAGVAVYDALDDDDVTKVILATLGQPFDPNAAEEGESAGNS